MHVRPSILWDIAGTNSSQYDDREHKNKTAHQVARAEAPTRTGTEGEQSLQQDRIPDDRRRVVRTGLANHETPGERLASEHHSFEIGSVQERENEKRQDDDCVFRCFHDKTKRGGWEISKGGFRLVGRSFERHGSAKSQHRLSGRAQIEVA